MAESVVREPAPAKLNAFLRVLRRRPDGFHEVETLVQPLTLADGVEARPSDAGLELVLAGRHAVDVPPGEENLALRAARALAEAAGVPARARLTLVKNVPVAAGLGGGSADAAAALRALDALWASRLGPERLLEVAAGVGSDVPALVPGGPVLARGRGERVERAEVARTWWVLVTPPFAVRAADAYRWWDEAGGVTGPDPGPLLEALRGGEPGAIGPLLFNDLERPVASRHPEVDEARGRLLAAGAPAALMCGSGPTVAGLAEDGRRAEEIASAANGTVVSGISRPPPVG